MNDDRDQPDRATNTAILGQVGQPPPTAVLGAVLASTAGQTPSYVAAMPVWGDKETTWRVIGCTNHAVFEVLGHKNVEDWYGSREHGEEREVVRGTVVPFGRIVSATFELTDVRSSAFGSGRALVDGTWRFERDGGDGIAVPTWFARQPPTEDALSGIIATLLAALR